jgi:hypothetical protein
VIPSDNRSSRPQSEVGFDHVAVEMTPTIPIDGERHMPVDYPTLVGLADGRRCADVACPECGPDRRSNLNRRRKVMRVWCEPDFATYHCARCGLRGYAHEDGPRAPNDPQRIAKIRAESEQRDQDHVARQLGKARWLWRTARPAPGTPAESYLKFRGIEVSPPATIRFLPPHKPEHHPAMVTAFGMPEEPEPGALSISDDAVVGVHLTLLKPDGSGKAAIEPNKITVGRCPGAPLVLAPMNDLLGLAITEGVEDALSVHQSTGLGAWAAGSAGRLPALADAGPGYTDCIRIYADADADGQRGAQELAGGLRARGLSVEIISSEDYQ